MLFTADTAQALCTQHVPLPARDPDLCASQWRRAPAAPHTHGQRAQVLHVGRQDLEPAGKAYATHLRMPRRLILL